MMNRRNPYATYPHVMTQIHTRARARRQRLLMDEKRRVCTTQRHDILLCMNFAENDNTNYCR